MSARRRFLLLLTVLLVAALAAPASVAAQTPPPTADVTIAKVWNYDLAGPGFDPSIITVSAIRIEVDGVPQEVVPGTTLQLEVGATVTGVGEVFDGELPDECDLLIGFWAPYTVNELEPTMTLYATNSVVCEPDLGPSYTVTFEKVWDLDLAGGLVEEGDLEVTFDVDVDGELYEAVPGETWDLDLGETVEVVEEFYEGDLPEGCEVYADLGDPYTATDEDPHGTITVTNEVVCEEEPGYEVTFEKVWDLDDAAGYVEEGDIEVSFEVVIGDGIIEVFPGETVEMFAGESAEVIGEWLDDDLPDNCSLRVDYGEVFTPSDEDPSGTITVTNTVTCEEAPGPVPKPETKPVRVERTELPRTGLPIGLLTLLGLGLTTSGTVLVRRR
jgi:hypothetical protein